MKIVEEIRDAISKIDGAMCETPSELGATGTVEGRARAATVWHPLGEQQTDRVALLQNDDEISESSFGPELEELLEFGAELDIGAVKQGLGGETGDEIRRSTTALIHAVCWQFQSQFEAHIQPRPAVERKVSDCPPHRRVAFATPNELKRYLPFSAAHLLGRCFGRIPTPAVP